MSKNRPQLNLQLQHTLVLNAIGQKGEQAKTTLGTMGQSIGKRGLEDRHKVLMNTFCGPDDIRSMALVVHRAHLCGYLPLLLRAWRSHPVLGPLIQVAGMMPW